MPPAHILDFPENGAIAADRRIAYIRCGEGDTDIVFLGGENFDPTTITTKSGLIFTTFSLILRLHWLVRSRPSRQLLRPRRHEVGHRHCGKTDSSRRRRYISLDIEARSEDPKSALHYSFCIVDMDERTITELRKLPNLSSTTKHNFFTSKSI